MSRWAVAIAGTVFVAVSVLVTAAGWTQPKECLLPLKIGPCKALIRRYAYFQSSGTCEMFLFGGCQPNLNNFKTKEACEQRCIDIVHES
ncbi:hypothetical protein R5R35_014649 [Gryllus longicercus]|uniref:BPTI/Kunitz inhibitor domain-containing protein n=1 Tax=Gryllus longicercus TaxID=2509291 RepID=A0AAN9VHR2_9ORTH